MGEYIAHGLAAHGLLGARLFDGNPRGNALVSDFQFYNLAGVFQHGGIGVGGGTVIGRCCFFFDGIAGQRQGLGGCQPISVTHDGVHQISVALVVNLKDSPSQRRPGGQAVGGVIISGFLDDLDLSAHSGVRPCDGGAAAVLDVEGLGLGVQNVPIRTFQFTRGIFSVRQLFVDEHIALVIAFIHTQGVALGVGDQKLHAIDALPGEAVHLVDDGTPGLAVGDLQGGGLAVLYLDAVGGIVQGVALPGLPFHDFKPALLRLGKLNDAVAIGGEGANDLPVQPAYFKLYALDPRPGFLILFDDGEAADFGVIYSDGLGVAGVHFHRLRPGALVHHIAGQRRYLGNYQCAHHAVNPDFPGGAGLIQALAGQVAVVIIQIGTVRIGDLELHPGQGFAGELIQFFDHDGPLHFVVEAEVLHLPGLNLDGFGRGVQHSPLHRLDLLGGDGGTGLQPLQDDAARLVRHELAVAVSNDGPGAVGDKEGHAFDGGGSALNVFFDHQRRAGGVVEGQGLRVVGVHNHRLRPGGLVDGVAGDAGRFRHHQRAHHTIYRDFSLAVRIVDAIAGQHPIFIRHKFPGGGGDFKGGPLQGLPGEAVLFQHDQLPGGLVAELQCHRLARLDLDSLGSIVQNIIGPLPGFLCDHRHAGGETVHPYGPRAVRHKFAVGVADHAARAVRQQKFHIGQGLARHSILLYDQQGGHGLVAEFQRHRLARFYLHGLRGIVQDIARFCPGFLHDQRLAGVDIVNQNGPGAVAHIFSVGIAQQGAVRFCHQKLHIGQRLMGDAVDLLDQDGALGTVAKMQLHHILLLAGDVGSLRRGVDHVAAVAGKFFHHVGARLEPGDGEGAIF